MRWLPLWLMLRIGCRSVEIMDSSRRVCSEAEQAYIDNFHDSRHPEMIAILKLMEGPLCGGVFIESGANNGRNSITLPFERAGWRGLCVEAAPSLFAMLDFLLFHFVL